MSTQPVTQPTLLPTDEVIRRCNLIVDELSGVFFERRSAITAIMLAVLAKQHVFLLGDPGTGKSLLTTSLFARFTNATWFEALLSKTLPAEAILGPYDVPRLRDHGDMHRKFNGFLPTANFAMLDEAGKMSPTLGHNLLAILNERKLHQVNGTRSYLTVPLYTMCTGSNELPTAESDDAAALWDRLLVRVVVNYIREPGNWLAMLTSDMDTSGTEVDFPSLANVIDTVVPTVTIPNDVQQVLHKLLSEMATHNLVVSDRRWRQSMTLLRASATLNGRSQVAVDDLEVLRWTLWEEPSAMQSIERMVLGLSNPLAEFCLDIIEKADEVAEAARAADGMARDAKTQEAVKLLGNLRVLSDRVKVKREEALRAGSSTTKLDEAADHVAAIVSTIQSAMLNMMGV